MVSFPLYASWPQILIWRTMDQVPCLNCVWISSKNVPLHPLIPCPFGGLSDLVKNRKELDDDCLGMQST